MPLCVQHELRFLLQAFNERRTPTQPHLQRVQQNHVPWQEKPPCEARRQEIFCKHLLGEHRADAKRTKQNSSKQKEKVMADLIYEHKYDDGNKALVVIFGVINNSLFFILTP